MKRGQVYLLRLDPTEASEEAGTRPAVIVSRNAINQYILYTLTKDISYKEAERTLRNRIKEARSREEALRLLEAIVPDVPPLPEDTILPAK